MPLSELRLGGFAFDLIVEVEAVLGLQGEGYQTTGHV